MMCGLQGVFCDLQDLKGLLDSVAVSHPFGAKNVAENRRHILAISIWSHPIRGRDVFYHWDKPRNLVHRKRAVCFVSLSVPSN
jgi:hypothetical protein